MSRLRILILGSAAGGGLPQWNCGCRNCSKARAGEIPTRTQSSIAVSADGISWAVINASPDIREQINRTPALHPCGLRNSPITSVLVTNGDIDHIAGLLTLRESQCFTLFSTGEIAELLHRNRIFDALNRDQVARRPVLLKQAFELVPNLVAELYPVPGKVPLFMEEGEVETDLQGEQTVGVRLSSGDAVAHYIPGCAALTDELRGHLDGAGMVLFDGTVWQNNEMQAQGVGEKTGERMGHMAISGQEGTIAAFGGIDIERKVFVHMNNTNPVLDPSTEERRIAEAAGWTISEDGMELTL